MKCPGCKNKDCNTCIKQIKQLEDLKGMRR